MGKTNVATGGTLLHHMQAAPTRRRRLCPSDLATNHALPSCQSAPVPRMQAMASLTGELSVPRRGAAAISWHLRASSPTRSCRPAAQRQLEVVAAAKGKAGREQCRSVVGQGEAQFRGEARHGRRRLSSVQRRDPAGPSMQSCTGAPCMCRMRARTRLQCHCEAGTRCTNGRRQWERTPP